MSIKKFWYYYNDEDDGKVKPKDPLNTLTGSIVQFLSSQKYPFQGLTAEIVPIQDLHGQANPYPAGAGKNICNPDGWEAGFLNTSGYLSSQDATKLEKTSPYIDIDGMTGSITFSWNGNFPTSSGNTAWRALCFYTEASSSGFIYPRVAGEGNTALTATIPEGAKYARVSCRTYGKSIEAQVENSASVTTYAPYENICPISGWTGVNVFQRGKNLAKKLSDMTVIAAPSAYSGNGHIDYIQDGLILGNCMWNGSTIYGSAMTTTVNVSGDTVTFTCSNSSYGIGIFGAVPPNVTLFKRVTTTTIEHTGITFYDKDGYVIGSSLSDKVEFLTPAGTAYARFNFRAKNNTTMDLSNFRVSFADEGYTDYDADSTTLSIDWTDSAGTVYGGTVTFNQDGSADLTVNYAKHKFENVAANWGSGYSTLYFRLTFNMAAKNLRGSTKCLCNYFTLYPNVYTPGNAGWSYKNDSNGTCYLQFRFDGVSNDGNNTPTPQAFRDWVNAVALAGNPLELTFELVEPETYHFDSVGQLETLLGLNNVWADTGDVEVTVYGVPVTEPDADALTSLNILLGNAYTRTGDDPTDEEALDIIMGGTR